jgi:hypothetical protein
LGNLKETDSLEELGVEVRIILTYISISQIGFRGTLGFHRTPFGFPREIVK